MSSYIPVRLTPKETKRDNVSIYVDSGCRQVGPSCLECPLPECLEDVRDGRAGRPAAMSQGSEARR